MTSELQKQKLLNEKLENDLLSMGTSDRKLNGDGTHMSAEDVLAGLELPKKPTVGIIPSYFSAQPSVFYTNISSPSLLFDADQDPFLS